MPRESKADLQKRSDRILATLKKSYSHVRCSLVHKNPLQLLVATILSAQCTDQRVNIVTKDLFRKYKTAKDYAAADQDELQKDIHSTGFYRNKAENLRKSGRRIVEQFGGEVPDTMEDLLTLPGVARKTANVVLGNAFGKNEGIVVDTHVARLAERLKLTRFKKPRTDKIEQDLIALIPRDHWALFSHMLVFHGRGLCTARKPACGQCELATLCPSAGTV